MSLLSNNHSGIGFINTFKKLYSEEMNIIYSILCFLLDKESNTEFYIENISIFENIITIEGYLTGYNNNQINQTSSKEYVYEILKNNAINISLSNKNAYNTFVTIQFNKNHLDENKKYLYTYLKLLNIYKTIKYTI